MTTIVRVSLDLYPCAQQMAPSKYYPAMQMYCNRYVWHNVVKATYVEAVAFAERAIGNAREAAQNIVDQWNIQEDDL